MPVKTQNEFIRVGELARLAGVSTDTLRHYERLGVLPPPRRSRNGYREYAVQTLEQIQQVRRALRVGFSLAEIAQIFQVRNNGGVPCQQVRKIAATKLAEVESQINELLSLRDELCTMLEIWDELLAQTPDGTRAGLLQQLALATPQEKQDRSPLTPKWRRAKARTGEERKARR